MQNNAVAVQEDRNHLNEIAYRRRMTILLLVAVCAVAMLAFPVLAAPNNGNTPKASEMMGNLISLMCSMFKYVGIALLVWAIIQFILATKRSDADSKADAIQTAVCGIALIGIAGIIGNLKITSEDINDGALDN